MTAKRPSSKKGLQSRRWSLQDAKTHLSQIVREAQRSGPQRVHGKDAAVIVAAEELDNTLRPLFAGRVLGITEDVIVRGRTMVAEGRKRRHTFGEPDLFIAAVAALQDLIVVTRDINEFVEARAPVFDPWTHRFHRHGKATLMRQPVTLEALSMT
ncbi:type II toxin-antitoxin system prevent-host-death family antitoxin [Bradyrhizobium sp. RP6]|uniref:type II toxin-antitoxin system prevent-host-death family antitoxin n=1 Tax=Bradyrhizobium sp. RP6 TaxID=2489596 RepID=UPI000F53DCDD|nr:type II toxin-antitoxin system prevent-host-death family antitoxin [Bradyrhizobium sp. RP6]RQH08711.1 type II toxin-antitoxin system prevent-host-death family antitoxin [Bradyrhizobium sp. RP6]